MEKKEKKNEEVMGKGQMIMLVLLAATAIGCYTSFVGVCTRTFFCPHQKQEISDASRKKILKEFSPEVFYYPDENCEDIREFHTKKRLGFLGHVSYKNSTGDFISSEEEKKTPSFIRQLLQEMWKIDGITGISIYPYKIRIEKSPAYKWGEIFPQLKTVFTKYLTVKTKK